MIRFFTSSLEKDMLTCFRCLLPNSVYTFDDLKTLFIQNYSCSIIQDDVTEVIYKITPCEEESFTKLLRSFKEAAASVDKIHEKILCVLFNKWLDKGRNQKFLTATVLNVLELTTVNVVVYMVLLKWKFTANYVAQLKCVRADEMMTVG
ncbi:uncharacterized protein LOC113352384 [Papaver somniferum]|uniref:uncharacterized protein LOC113352384 n=1 Tax=Papaver somniferum TaxID=3469 RepID=UPI000E70486E|nr:uncharacterized protein LOC113352384 [Papaver somniferum]